MSIRSLATVFFLLVRAVASASALPPEEQLNSDLQCSDADGSFIQTQRSVERHGELAAPDEAMVYAAFVQHDAQKAFQPDLSHDWLWGYSTTRCKGGPWDNTQYTVASRIFLACLFMAMLVSVVYAGCLKTDINSLELFEGEQRRNDLDWARILCIICVVGEHSGGWHWSEHNLLFVLEWVLPFLYITSGTGWMMSRKTVGAYMVRLMAVLAVGVSANLTADQINGKDWKSNFSFTVYQMTYVVMLVVLSFCTEPLRQALSWRRRSADAKADWAHYMALLFFGVVTGIGFAYFLMPNLVAPPHGNAYGSFHAKMTTFLGSAPVATVQVFGLLFLCHLACLFKANDVLPWLLLMYIYLPCLVIPWQGVGFAHNIELFIFAMVAESWKIRGSRSVASKVQGYWPLLIVFFIFMACPDMQGRCDLVPASTLGERFRFYAIEMALCLCLVTGVFHVADTSHLEWLNMWALYAYCFHVAWARLLPQPYGAAMTYGSLLFFYLWARHRSPAKEAMQPSSMAKEAMQPSSMAKGSVPTDCPRGQNG